MMQLFGSLKKLNKLEQVLIDNNVFKLHYKVTVILLVVFSVLLTSKQYFGEPISCDIEKKDKELVNTYCWMMGTHIVKDNLGDPDEISGLGIQRNSEIFTQIYYQWVCLSFCVQAIFFYFPRYLWKIWEAGRLRLLISDFSGPLGETKWSVVSKKNLIKMLATGRYVHNLYAIRYSICEILNFLNVIVQIYFLNWFLQDTFKDYGIRYISNEPVNPMDSVFPKMAKCVYKFYGPSGSIQNREGLCILPLNVLNEKIYLVLWFWLFILLVVSATSVLYRAVFLFVPMFRVYLLRAQTRGLDKKKTKFIVKKMSFGEFFILYKIGKNVNPVLYRDLVTGMYEFLGTNNLSSKKFPSNLEV